MSIVYRPRASVVCVHEGRLLVIRAREPATGREYLLVPGGAIEPGETPAEAALRETLEETGYRVRIDVARQRICRYEFDWGGLRYDCLTHFFRATLEDEHPTGEGLDADYLLARQWIDLAEVDAAMSYHPVIQQAVGQLAAPA